METIRAAILLVIVLLLLFVGRLLLRSCLGKLRLERRLDSINEDYERLRSIRQDVVYHHGWATSRGDFKEADSHEEHCIEIDKKLDQLRKHFEAVKAGLEVEVDGEMADGKPEADTESGKNK
mmetsp:Transcript_13160/g.29983  ORF Transcript_13160/g.29983 Transcript_13160/m.29983 type:complete len:122 (+) Transcript_13160:56-421(+)